MTHEEFISQIKEIVEKSEKNEQDRKNLKKNIALDEEEFYPKMLPLCYEGMFIAFECIRICKEYVKNNA